jgi:hypothetical protein
MTLFGVLSNIIFPNSNPFIHFRQLISFKKIGFASVRVNSKVYKKTCKYYTSYYKLSRLQWKSLDESRT